MFDIEDGRVVGQWDESLPGLDPQAQAGRVEALGTQTLICGAVSRPLAALLAAKGVRVIPFTAGTVEDVLAAWLAESLPNPALSMPGCCGRMKRCHGGGTGGRGRRGWGLNERRPPNGEG